MAGEESSMQKFSREMSQVTNYNRMTLLYVFQISLPISDYAKDDIFVVCFVSI